MTNIPESLPSLDRRQVLKYGAGFGLALAWPNSRVLGANDDIRVGIVGVNGRGQAHMGAFSTMKGVRITALCDTDPTVLDARVNKIADTQKIEVNGFGDMRDMFEKGNIDAVSTATPNHWHTLTGIWAIQAGKDVYVEKPISHNVWEGRQLVKLARKEGKICQGGTQSRSLGSIQAAVKYVKDGNLGKIKYVKGMCYKPRPSIGKGGGGEIPAGVNYDLWCGPAEMESPLGRKKFHYDWHWFYAYGNGDMGNQGIHQMDVARWFLGEDKIAPRSLSIGGRLGYDDDGQTPNTQIVYHDYDAAPLIFETRGLPKAKEFQENDWGKNMNDPDEFPGMSGISVVVACENGFLFTDAGGKVKVKDLAGKDLPTPEPFKSDDIFENFIHAVKSRKVEEQYADCEETHISSALCHTGLISHRLGAKLKKDEVLERIKDDALLTERFGSMADHLAANGVDLAADGITTGPMVKFNPETEWAEGNGDLDAAANALATREYRKPYTVPEVL
ncbi:MAG: Gfo/Idh/MocA family oxidoreductase [Verrucomicrobiales bacterium]|nr:Gfo/Idh/MocA family oxidoreductase [Verrucomicrobiales bacterium]HQZ28511.1 Gfo/Idh/MocA family oxidoreductase [Verrucomicrobiales bacterium]